MTRYDFRYCSSKRLTHLALREPVLRTKPIRETWHEALCTGKKLTPDQCEAALRALTREGTQAIPKRFRTLRAQQLLDLIRAKRHPYSIGGYGILNKKLAKGLRQSIERSEREWRARDRSETADPEFPKLVKGLRQSIERSEREWRARDRSETADPEFP